MLDHQQYQGMSVFVYLRQSTKTESGKQVQSIEDQHRDCRIEAEKWGLNIVEIIEEDESAWKPHLRPKFKKMLKELSYLSPKKRRADGILAWHPNRLSRNALEAGMIIQMIDDELIKNLFFYNYSFHNDTSGKEHLTIEFARAKGSSDSTSETVIRGIRSRELQGAMVSHVKYGYERKREHKISKLCSLFPIPHPDNFPVIKRIFELALEGGSAPDISKRIKKDYPHCKTPGVSEVDKRLRDSFYCGTWVIKKGTKEERVIDLSQITQPDGTTFQAAVSKDDFEEIQQSRSKRINSGVRRKRLNPLPGIIQCKTCGNHMYPTYRKIRCAGNRIEDRLGYECQTKTDTGRCPQGRVKVDILFGAIEEVLQLSSKAMTKKVYQKYLLALHLMNKRTTIEIKKDKSKINAALDKAISQRQKLIEQRAALIIEKAYDIHSKNYFEKKINQISDEITDLQNRKQNYLKSHDQTMVSFYRFLELRENLGQYWNSANYEKKAIFSKILLSNLTIEGKEVANLSVKKPFSEVGKGSGSSIGMAGDVQLEPRLKGLWDWYTAPINAKVVSDIDAVWECLNGELHPQYPIVLDIAELSRT